MPAGTPAVTAFKVYTRGKPAPPGELPGHLGRGGAAGDRGTPAAWRSAADPEADVWANMARNLARQPEMPAALDLLERAHRIERGAARALQRGLHPAEQREAEGLAKITLRRTWQRRRMVERAAMMTDQLGSLVHQQGTALEALGRLGPAVRDVAARALAAMQPVLRQIAAPMRDKRRQTAEQRHERGHAARLSRGPSLGM